MTEVPAVDHVGSEVFPAGLGAAAVRYSLLGTGRWKHWAAREVDRSKRTGPERASGGHRRGVFRGVVSGPTGEGRGAAEGGVGRRPAEESLGELCVSAVDCVLCREEGDWWRQAVASGRSGGCSGLQLLVCVFRRGARLLQGGRGCSRLVEERCPARREQLPA